MGRWAQRQRRGSVGVGHDTALRVLSVTVVDPTHARILWSRPVSVTAGATADVNFNLGGITPTSITATSATQTTLVVPDAGDPGDAWGMTAQPAWLLTSALVPENGVTV